MSAMPALDWPEDDPASETDATWTFPDWLMPAETARRRSSPDQPARRRSSPDQPARPQAPCAQAARSAAAHGPAIRAQVVPAQVVRTQAAATPAVQARAPHGTTAPAPLRLTRRGRIVVAAAAALLVTLLSLLLTGGAWAAGPAAPSHGANRSLAQVVVLPGQSLWSVAQTAEPNADPRQVMQQIIELNGLAGDTIQAGQRLWVPRG
jgi:hypothetical protein